MKLTDQLVAELRRQAGELERLNYGEIVFKVQDGRVVHWEVKKSYKVGVDQKRRQNERNKFDTG